MLYNSYVILFQTFVFVLTVSDEENIPLMILHRPGSVIKSTSGVMLVSDQFAFLKVSASVVVCRLCLPSAGDQDYLRWMKSSAKLDVTATFTIGLAKRCYRWTSEPCKCSVYDLIVSETVTRRAFKQCNEQLELLFDQMKLYRFHDWIHHFYHLTSWFSMWASNSD